MIIHDGFRWSTSTGCGCGPWMAMVDILGFQAPSISALAMALSQNWGCPKIIQNPHFNDKHQRNMCGLDGFGVVTYPILRHTEPIWTVSLRVSNIFSIDFFAISSCSALSKRCSWQRSQKQNPILSTTSCHQSSIFTDDSTITVTSLVV